MDLVVSGQDMKLGAVSFTNSALTYGFDIIKLMLKGKFKIEEIFKVLGTASVSYIYTAYLQDEIADLVPVKGYEDVISFLPLLFANKMVAKSLGLKGPLKNEYANAALSVAAPALLAKDSNLKEDFARRTGFNIKKHKKKGKNKK